MRLTLSQTVALLLLTEHDDLHAYTGGYRVDVPVLRNKEHAQYEVTGDTIHRETIRSLQNAGYVSPVDEEERHRYKANDEGKKALSIVVSERRRQATQIIADKRQQRTRDARRRRALAALREANKDRADAAREFLDEVRTFKYDLTNTSVLIAVQRLAKADAVADAAEIASNEAAK